MGTLYAARAALVVMRRQGRGHIIAVSSIAGRRGVGGSSVYSATKAAQIGFIEALRAQFHGSDHHPSVVNPVATTTQFHDATPATPVTPPWKRPQSAETGARDVHARLAARRGVSVPQRVAGRAERRRAGSGRPP
jgi:short-subunit dehydrogenase